MRTLAIDPGTRRIGLALSDEGGRFATPLEVLDVRAAEQSVAPILRLVEREAVRRLVVGLPLNMDGTIGPAARAAIVFGRQLAERAGLPVVFVDERLSSHVADEQLSERRRAGDRLTRGGKKKRRDALAAAHVLQSFLDGQRLALDVS